MELQWTSRTDRKAHAEWDEFVMNSPRAFYCHLSTWLNSMGVYGFDNRILIAREAGTGRIIGGAGLYLFGMRGFRIMNCPLGPVVDTGREAEARRLLDEIVRFARSEHAFLLQMQFPCSADQESPSLLTRLDLPEEHRAREGMVFRTGNVPNQMLWIDFPTDVEGEAWNEKMLMTFASRTRRDIRSSLRSGLELFEAKTEAELKTAYSVIVKNGEELGYATRSWDEFGESLIEQVSKGQAIVLTARRDGQTLGAHYGLIGGRKWTYMMGGTVRVQPDPKIGHFLHWHVILRAKSLGLLGYDLTTYGNEGVRLFKSGFRPVCIPFIPPRYYVFSPVPYFAFSKVYPFLRRRKKFAANLLRGVTRMAPRRRKARDVPSGN